MRVHPVLAATLAAALLAISFVGALARPVRADTPTTRVDVTIIATASGTNDYFFSGPNPDHPDTIVIPAVPAIITITAIAESGTPHTLTIRSTESTDPLVDIDLPTEGSQGTVTFTMWAADRIEIAGRNETAETEGGNLLFVCTPHKALGMVGYIVVGGVQEAQPEPPEKGVFLRAYWIGVLGIAGTLLLIGISYFVIKSSSTHFRDHHEHIRRGGP